MFSRYGNLITLLFSPFTHTGTETEKLSDLDQHCFAQEFVCPADMVIL